MKEYVLRILLYAVVIAIVSCVTFGITGFIPDYNILWLLVKGIAAAVISNGLFLLAYYRTREFGQVREIVLRILKRGNA